MRAPRTLVALLVAAACSTAPGAVWGRSLFRPDDSVDLIGPELIVASSFSVGAMAFAIPGLFTAFQIGGKVYDGRPREAWIAAGYVVGIGATTCAITSLAIIAAYSGNVEGFAEVSIATGTIGLTNLGLAIAADVTSPPRHDSWSEQGRDARPRLPPARVPIRHAAALPGLPRAPGLTLVMRW